MLQLWNHASFAKGVPHAMHAGAGEARKVAVVEVSRSRRARIKPLTITNQGLHGRLKPSHHSKGEPEHIEAVITKMMHPIALEYPQGHMLTHSNIQSASNQ